MILPRTSPVTPATDQMERLANFLRSLAYKAGTIAREHFRNPAQLATKNKASNAAYDPVTEADTAAEAAMRKLIKETYPTHGIYGEEYGFEAGTSGLTWVLDPIDGTRSFMTGMLHWGVLIALFNGKKPILGGLYQPILDELFCGHSGQASIRQAQGGFVPEPIKTSHCDQLQDAVVCITHPEIFIEPVEQAALADLLKQTKMSRYGGDCYHYALLAMGLVELCVESSLQPYDIQALIPLVEGAGGLVTTWSGGDPADGGQIVAAANKALHTQALEILAPAAL